MDKRLAADGRGLQEVQINDQFAKLTEALYVAESKAREAVDMRQKVRKMGFLCTRFDASAPGCMPFWDCLCSVNIHTHRFVWYT